MTLPNFLVIGAAKSGTTALYFQLKQHPQVFLSPIKEPHFFSYLGQGLDMRGPGDYIPQHAIRDWPAYEALFDGVTKETAIGEASPTYLYVPGTAERIQARLPQARLVVILRQPAERAFSAYMHVRRDGREPEEQFQAALRLERRRIAANWEPIWHYVESGYYYRQLKRYYEHFDRAQVRVYLYEHYQSNPAAVLRDLCRFLEIREDVSFQLDVWPNVSGDPRSQLVDRLLAVLFLRRNPLKSAARRLFSEQTRLRATEALRNWNLAKPTLSDQMRADLNHIFREDVLALEALIDQDLSDWLR